MNTDNTFCISGLKTVDSLNTSEILELGRMCFPASLYVNLRIAVIFIRSLVVTGVYLDRRLVGFAFGKVWGSTGEICSAAVDPEFRRKGVSKFLLEKLIQNFKDRGCVRVAAFIRHSNSTSIAMANSIGLTRQKVWSFPFLLEEILPWGTHYTMEL